MIRCKKLILSRPLRLFHTCPKSFNQVFSPARTERPEDEVDVCIVGGGPAGLSAAIRLKQLEKEKGNEIRVVVLEKGSEIGTYLVCVCSAQVKDLDMNRFPYRLWSCDRTPRLGRTTSFLVFNAKSPFDSTSNLILHVLPHPQLRHPNSPSPTNGK